MIDIKIIKFPTKTNGLEKKQLKETINYLIDNSEGDFCIIFKTQNISHLLENGDKIEQEFVVGTSNIEIMKFSNENYFFKGFGDNRNRKYLKLK